MSDDIERRGNGRFAKGHSGNPEGARTRRRKELLTRDDLDRMVLEIAGSEESVVIAGQERRITIYEKNCRWLASGKPPNRLAAKDTIDIVNTAASSRELRQQIARQTRRPLEDQS